MDCTEIAFPLVRASVSFSRIHRRGKTAMNVLIVRLICETAKDRGWSVERVTAHGEHKNIIVKHKNGQRLGATGV